MGLDATKRGILSVQFFEERAWKKRSNWRDAQDEKAEVEAEAEKWKVLYDDSMAELNETAERLEQLKKRKEQLKDARKAPKRGGKSLHPNDAEFFDLREEQTALLKQLNDMKN